MNRQIDVILLKLLNKIRTNITEGRKKKEKAKHARKQEKTEIDRERRKGENGDKKKKKTH